MDHATPALLEPAQGIQCGALDLAFPYAWAHAISEDFSLTPVPNAPAWLAGATNVEGEIVPVFDLAAWVDPRASGPGRARLLVGGLGGDRAAIVFTGAARMVRYQAGAPVPSGPGAPPLLLRPFVLAASETSPPHWVLDGRRLLDALASALQNPTFPRPAVP
jgi:chemotaxis signal transduction protein